MTKSAIKVLETAANNRSKLPTSHCYTYPVTAKEAPPTKKSDTVWMKVKAPPSKKQTVDYSAELARMRDAINIHSDVKSYMEFLYNFARNLKAANLAISDDLL
jgi:hypothetical protein